MQESHIDHGNRTLEDESLAACLLERQMALTVCPLSNLKLKVIDNMVNRPMRVMLKKGLLATINSYDPAYYGGYMNDNFKADALDLSNEEIGKVAKNAFTASFLSEAEKRRIADESPP